MSGSSTVTVPGSSGSPPVTIASGSGDVLNLAAQIGAILQAIQSNNSADLLVVSANGGASAIPVPPTVSGTTKVDIILTGAGSVNASIPAGYDYVVDNSSGSNTLNGADLTLIGGSLGGAYGVTGTSTLVAVGGDNLLFASGTYLVSAGTGNDTISVVGTGTAAGGAGSNLIFSSGAGGMILSSGQDTVAAGTGNTTVDSSGSKSLLFGNFASTAALVLSVSGTQSTVSAGNSNTTITTSGSGALVFGGFTSAAGSITQTDSGTSDTLSAGSSNTFVTLTGSKALVFGGASAGGSLSVLDKGSNDTISGLSSATTVTAGAGSTGLFVFGGTGGLNFVGGTSLATVVSGTGTNTIAGGTGGIVTASNGDDVLSAMAGAGATLFGSANHSVNYLGAGNLLYAAGAGNETLNAANSSGSNKYFASTTTGANDSIAGGSGFSTFTAGGGADTFTGGIGGNSYFFLAKFTDGSHDVVTNLASSDSVSLIGYDASKSTTDVSGGNTTLTLSDNTQITFLNTTNISSNLHFG